MKWNALIVASLLVNSCLHAQQVSPYQLRMTQDVLLTAGSLGLAIYARDFQHKIQPFSEEEIRALDDDDLWEIDESATENWSTQASITSDYFLYGAEFAPLGLMASKHIRKEVPTIGLMYIQTLLLTSGLTDFTKSIALRPRPFVFNENAPFNKKIGHEARASFFSGHTSVSAASCFFAATVYADYHPNSPLKPYVWALAVTIPAATGYFRYKAGKHYPTDVMAGYAVGAFTGWLIPRIHRRKSGHHSNRKGQLSMGLQHLSYRLQF